MMEYVMMKIVYQVVPFFVKTNLHIKKEGALSPT